MADSPIQWVSLDALRGQIVHAEYGPDGDELVIILTYADGRCLQIDLTGKYEPEALAVRIYG